MNLVVQGIEVLSWTQSIRAWRQHFQGKLAQAPVPMKNGICQICYHEGEQRGQINSRLYGQIYCLCNLRKKEASWITEFGALQSHHEHKTLEEYQVWGDSQEIRTNLYDIKATLTEWLKWPDCWITLYGTYGNGKSHLLTALADALLPYSLYMTTNDFETRLFDSLDRGTTNEYLAAVKYAPFLFLDDLGAEHGAEARGGFVKNKLQEIIAARYMMPGDFITVTATNLNKSGLMEYSPRMGDRLTDKDVARYIQVKAYSWRQHADHQ